MKILDADATAAALGWPVLLAAIEATIADANAGSAACPPRMSMPLSDDAVWLLMPSVSRRADIGACKLITVHAGNRRHGLPTIQGDILVIRAQHRRTAGAAGRTHRDGKTNGRSDLVGARQDIRRAQATQ